MRKKFYIFPQKKDPNKIIIDHTNEGSDYTISELLPLLKNRDPTIKSITIDNKPFILTRLHIQYIDGSITIVTPDLI